MILTLVGSYLGGSGGAYVFFRENEHATWFEAVRLAAVWPFWWFING